MRHVSTACLLAAALALAACAAGVPTTSPRAEAPQADVGPAPATPAGVAPGERVIRTITLPKGQTPHDTPMPPLETVPAPPPTEIPDEAMTEVSMSGTEDLAPGERVIKTVCLPKGETPDGMAYPTIE